MSEGGGGYERILPQRNSYYNVCTNKADNEMNRKTENLISSTQTYWA